MGWNWKKDNEKIIKKFLRFSSTQFCGYETTSCNSKLLYILKMIYWLIQQKKMGSNINI